MKKIAAGLVAALAVLYPAMSWVTGYRIEKSFDAAVQQASAATPYIHVVQSTFRRGWFTSQQEVTVEMAADLTAALVPAAGGANAPPEAPRVTFRSMIRHGPICGLACVGLAHVDTRILFSGAIQSWLSTVFGAQDLVSIHGRLGFFGGGSSVVSSPPLKDVALGDGARFSWDGLTLSSTFSANMDSYTVRGSLPHALYAGADGKRFEIADVALDTQSHRVLRTLRDGESSLRIGRLGIAGAPGARSVAVNDMRVESLSSVHDGFMTIGVKWGSAAIVAAPLTLSSTHIDLTFQHLQTDSLEQLSVAAQAINRDTSLTPVQRSGKMLSALKEPGIGLLAHQPQLSLDRISIAAGGGEALLRGTLHLDDVTAADFAAANAQWVVQKIAADLQLTIDDSLLQSLPGTGANLSAQLQPLVDQGLFTHANGRFSTHIVFQQGAATFNGKSFPHPAASAPANPAR